jgi:membrane protease YdiL (CAAX protease family)
VATRRIDPNLKFALQRLGFFAAIAFVTYVLASMAFFWMLGKGELLVIAVASNFTAACVATAVSLRVFERGQLADIGLGWSDASRRNLLVGLLGGMGAAMAVLLIPVAFRLAAIHPVPDQHFAWPNLVFFTVIFIFGASSEEMLFRGYGFQVFMRGTGPFGAIVPFSLLFAFTHAGNPSFGLLPFLNTIFWGILLGYAFWCSGDLWLPIGLHFGWNWVLPMLGDNLSGLTMRITGCAMNWKIGDLWSGGAYGVEGGLLTTAIVIVLFLYLNKAPIEPQLPYLLYKDRS